MGRHIEVIARGISICENHVLVCRNLKRGYCYLPGGHVEFGESAAEALAREMMEECGEVIRGVIMIGIDEVIFEQPTKRGTEPHHEVNVMMRMELRRGGQTIRPVVSRESHIGFEWIPVRSLRRQKLLPRSADAFVRVIERG